MSIRACLVASLGLIVAATAGAAPGNGKIAYVRDGAVFIANADGSAEARIAENAYADAAIWSPDGAHVAYLRQIHVPNGLEDIVPVAAAADGSGATPLVEHGEFTLACWLDPSTIVARSSYIGSTNPYVVYNDLYTFRLDGTTRRLTSDGGSKFVSAQGCAPDGSGVAYTQQQPDSKWKAFFAPRDGSAPRLLTPADFFDSEVAWSPSGTKLAFVRAGAEAGLFVADTAGGEATRLTPLGAAGVRWSPDGRTLLFTHRYTDYSHCSRYGCAIETEARTIDASGAGQRLLAAGVGAQGWSPDGARIVLSGGNRSLVMNVDGSCKTVLPENVPDVFDWQPVPGQPAASELECADLALSTNVQYVDLPLAAATSYTITVTNNGNERASTVAVDQPPGHRITLVDVQPSQGSCTRADGLHCDLGPLPAGASAQVAVSVHLEGVSRATLLPRASAPEPDGYPFDNSGRVDFTVLNCTILGTFSADTLFGTPGRDKICGRFGNDTIYGNAGNDVIYGGEGADTIYGGNGRDVIHGGGGNDVVLARDGIRDVIDCGPEKDTAVVDRFDVVSHCRTVYRPPRKRHAPAPR